jgi:hypothetical protein
VTLPSPAPAGGAVVTVISLFSTALSVASPGEISIQAGQSIGEIQVSGLQPGTASVFATSPDYVPGGLTIPVGYLLTLPTAVKVGVGLEKQATVSLPSAISDGMFVTIRSSNPAVALVSAFQFSGGQESVPVFIPEGTTAADYWVQGVGIGTATFTATAENSLPAVSSVQIVQPAIQIENLPASIAATAARVPFIVSMGVATPDGTSLQERQSALGFNPLTFTVSNSSAGVAQLVTQAGAAQSRDVAIGFGEQATPSTLVAGGIEFDPVASGQTTVTVTRAGFLTTTAGSVTVTVTNGQGIARQHIGALDPLTEGFALVGVTSGTPVLNDQGSGLDSWRVLGTNASTGYYKSSALTPAEKQAAMTNGWVLTSRMRFESGTIYLAADFIGSGRRFDISLLHGAGGSVIVRLPTSVIPFVGIDYTLTDSPLGYHLYELVYNPLQQTADLYIDGVKRISGYGGTTQFQENFGIIFGASVFNAENGVGYHNLARLQIF